MFRNPISPRTLLLTAASLCLVQASQICPCASNPGSLPCDKCRQAKLNQFQEQIDLKRQRLASTSVRAPSRGTKATPKFKVDDPVQIQFGLETKTGLIRKEPTEGEPDYSVCFTGRFCKTPSARFPESKIRKRSSRRSSKSPSPTRSSSGRRSSRPVMTHEERQQAGKESTPTRTRPRRSRVDNLNANDFRKRYRPVTINLARRLRFATVSM